MSDDSIPPEMQVEESASSKANSTLRKLLNLVSFAFFLAVYLVVPFLPFLAYRFGAFETAVVVGFVLLLSMLWYDFGPVDEER